jgi:hypothetical protein
MTRLLFHICASLAGVGVITVLSAGMVTPTSILIAAAAGAFSRLPVAWIVTRPLLDRA